jgi:hypothetical protein
LTERTRSAQAEKLFDLATKAVDAVRYVPPGRLYDPDRADVLKTAGGLACMAAMLDSPNDTWRCAFSPKAAYAVRLLERAKTLNLDQSGQVREQLAVAYALAGRPAEAIRLAEEIRGTRKGSVPFLITLARLLALNDRARDGLDVIQDAVTQGYTDILFHRGGRGVHRAPDPGRLGEVDRGGRELEALPHRHGGLPGLDRDRRRPGAGGGDHGEVGDAADRRRISGAGLDPRGAGCLGGEPAAG